MNLAKVLILGFSGAAIAVGAGLFTANELTKETFLDSFGGKKKVTSTDASEKGSVAWKILAKKFEYRPSQEAYSSEFLKLIKEDGKTVDEEKLMKLCGDISSRKSRSLFSPGDTKLFNSYEKFCISDFKNIFVEAGFDSIYASPTISGETTQIKANLSALKNHSDSESNGKVDEDLVLKSLKQKLSNSSGAEDNTENQKDLMAWCSSKSGNYYSNQKENTWKLVDRYCLSPDRKKSFQ